MKKIVNMKNEMLEIKLAGLSSIALLSMIQFMRMKHQDLDLSKKLNTKSAETQHWYCLTI